MSDPGRDSNAFGGVASALATVVGIPVLVVSTLLCSVSVMMATVVRWDAAITWLLRTWARVVLLASGVHLKLTETGDLSKIGQCIVMANHSSLYDIPVLFLALPFKVRFLAKKQLFAIPFLGGAMRAAGFVSVDRGQTQNRARAFSSAKAQLGEGCSLAIFPEETRSLDGRLLPFRGGGSLLAISSGLPVLPVGIRGALEVKPRNRRTIHPGTISVHYGTLLLPSDFENRKQLNVAIRDQINGLIGASQDQENG